MELVNVYSTGRTVDYQKYGDKDNQLIISSYTNTEMDPNADVVELTVYGESGEFLDYNPIISTFKVAQGNVNPVTGLYSKIELDPKTDVNALGLTRGRVNSQYNFLKPLFNSSNAFKYWIKEISPSGTEIKLGNQNLSNEQIRAGFSEFQAYVSTKSYYVDFYLNFGQNRLIIANNAILIEENGESYIAVKLYEPLPEDFEVKDTLWLCDRVADSVIYTIDTQILDDAQASQNALRGPNNRIKVRERIGQTTPYYSYTSLFSSNVSSSIQQLLSYYQDKAIEINVDYSDFSNFIHFSSATERINNFVYKLTLIEQYNAEIADTATFSSMSLSSLTIVSQSNTLAQQNIDNIINKFDTYEYYLYYSSESFAWPKFNSTKPYQLYSVTSSEALSWLGGETVVPTVASASILYSASLYDNRNPDKLSNAVPQYLLEDQNNESYLTFVDMIGQHFDNVWLYYKDLSNRYASFNSPDLGLSKDIVADALRGFGFNLYTNTSVSDNLYYTLFGVNQDGSLLPPTGSEIITNYVTSSIDTLSPKQLDSEIYKRFYHNLAYLLKTKGTQRGIKALIACYGIPEEILTVNEFGGNPYTTGSGVYEFNNQKINYFTQSAQLSDSLLSPYVTIQQYNTNNRLNSNDVEIAFSPANAINSNLVSSSGYVNINQLIGDPSHQYLDFYPDLKIVRDNYFASYDYSHSVWEYIRIIKYYNNSLFKTIKDWVPSRANASTGITIKSHILERNKYARHEPSMSFDNNISESIDMISIAGSHPGAVQGSTEYTETIFTQYGDTTLTYTEDLAKYTGRLSGSFVQATNGEAFDQDDYPDRLLPKRFREGAAYVWFTDGVMYSTFDNAKTAASSTVSKGYTREASLTILKQVYKNSSFTDPYTQSAFSVYLGLNDGLGNEYVVYILAFLSNIIISVTQTKVATISYNNTNYGATYQNYLTANRSKRFLELDYAYNQNVPVNLGLVTKSINDSINNNFNTYNNPYAPYADIQDYNYATRAFTDARYYGSKTKSLVYNTYTPPVSGSYEGDSSYGLSAAIDRNSYKIGWVKNIPNKTLNFPDKTQVFLKYLVDYNSSVLDLSLNNTNLFEVQNIFKSGDRVKVSISDINKPSNQKTLDGLKTIYRGGFSFDPIFYREGSAFQKFRWTEPLFIESLAAGVKGHSLNWISGIAGYDTEKRSILGGFLKGPAAAYEWTKNYDPSGQLFTNEGIYQSNFEDRYPELASRDWTCFEVAVNKANNRAIIDDPVNETNVANFTHTLSHNPIKIRTKLAENLGNNLTINDIPNYNRRGFGINYAGTGKRTQSGTSANKANYKFFIGDDETEYTLAAVRLFSGEGAYGLPRRIFEQRYVVHLNRKYDFPMTPDLRPCYIFDDLFNFNIYSSSIFDNQQSATGPGFYRELSDVTNKGKYMYVAPRSGEYKIKGSFPVIVRFTYDQYLNLGSYQRLNYVLGQKSGFYYNFNVPLEANREEDPHPLYRNLIGGDIDYFETLPVYSGATRENRSVKRAVDEMIARNRGSVQPSVWVSSAADIANRRFYELGISNHENYTLTKGTFTGTYNLVTLPEMDWELDLSSYIRQFQGNYGSAYTGNPSYAVIDGSWSKAILALNAHPYFVSMAEGFESNRFFDNNINLHLRYPGFSLRFYGVIEKCSNINSPTPVWEYVCSTKMNNFSTFGRDSIVADEENNFINVGNDWGGAYTYERDLDEPVNLRGNVHHFRFDCLFADDTLVNGKRGIEPKVNLNAGDVLRFRFFVLDFDCFTNRYGKSFTMEVGKPDILNINKGLGYPQFSKDQPETLTGLPYQSYISPLSTPNLSIEDTKQKFDVYEFVTTVSGSTVYSIEGNSLVLSEEFERLATTGSTYEPEAPASDNYSPVIDEFNVKQGDLVRFGAFNDNRIKYYTVKNAELDNSAILKTRAAFFPIQFSAGRFTSIAVQLYPDQAKWAGLPDAKTTRVYKFFDKLSKYGSNADPNKPYFGLKITNSSVPLAGIGTPSSPIIATVGLILPSAIKDITYPTNNGQSINIRYLQASLNQIFISRAGEIAPYDITSPNPDLSKTVGVTFEAVPLNQKAIDEFGKIFPSDYRITLDTDNLDAADLTINGQQIAILRPKPDETSVILDFKKRQDGEVAQTVLIPQDANKQIQDSVGTIYENLNTSLTNQLQ